MAFVRKVCKFVSTKFGFRAKRNSEMMKKLAGLNFSVFSNNCIGGVFLHDAGMRFNSPLVNLAMDGNSFIAFLENPRRYIEAEFEFIENYPKPFPVGIYKDIRVSFIHYHSKEEALQKWLDRSKRIIWNDIYIIATGHDGLEVPELMERFDKLEYTNKVMFTHHEWPQYEWAKHVKILEKHEKMPPLTEFITLNGKRLYDTAFDIATWIYECERARNYR